MRSGILKKEYSFRRGTRCIIQGYSRFIQGVSEIFPEVKLTGKTGKTNINLINAFDKNAFDSTGNKPMYTAIRVKRDVLKSSSIGFTGTNKLLDERMITTLSTDYVLNLGPLGN
jgi:hypothetical protein